VFTVTGQSPAEAKRKLKSWKVEQVSRILLMVESTSLGWSLHRPNAASSVAWWTVNLGKLTRSLLIIQSVVNLRLSTRSIVPRVVYYAAQLVQQTYLRLGNFAAMIVPYCPVMYCNVLSLPDNWMTASDDQYQADWFATNNRFTSIGFVLVEFQPLPKLNSRAWIEPSIIHHL